MLKRIIVVFVLSGMIFSSCYLIFRGGETIVVNKANKVMVDAAGSWRVDINNECDNSMSWSLSSRGGVEISGQFIDDDYSDVSIVYPSGKAVLIDKDGNIHEFNLTKE